MDTKTVNMLNAYMPNIGHYRTQFSSLNSLLGKTTLTGKISSLDIAENLFNFMEDTQKQFNTLQEGLINTLIEHLFGSCYHEASASVGIMAGILVHTVSERRLDTLSLAQANRFQSLFAGDNVRNHEMLDALRDHLHKYIELYTLYHNVLIVDMSGKILVAAKPPNVDSIDHAALKDVLQSGEPVETVTHIELGDNMTNDMLVNIAPIKNESGVLGALITFFDFQDEARQLCEFFKYYLPQTIVLILDEKNRVVYSDNEHRFPVGETVHMSQKDNYYFLDVGKKLAFAAYWRTKEPKHQSSIVSKWTFYRLVPLQVAFDTRRGSKEKEEDMQMTKELLWNSSLRTGTLDVVITEVENIRENLGDVVINGEIIASKSRSYALNPILDNIRLLSDQISALCIDSIQNLQKNMFQTIYRLTSKVAYSSTQLLDHYFYEKTNDCRWIARSKLFAQYLYNYMFSQVETSDTHKVIAKLEEINKAYKSYGDIVLFTSGGAVVANSHLIKGTHHTVSTEAVMALRNMINSNRYYFSPFEVPQFSGVTQPSYTMMAPLYMDNQFLGGIAFVIDMKEIAEILQFAVQEDFAIYVAENAPEEEQAAAEKTDKKDKADRSDKEKTEKDKQAQNEPKGNDIFACFIDQDKRIIATTKEIAIDDLNLEGKIDFRNPKSLKETIVFNDGSTYFVAIEPSSGYREFKAGNAHKNLLSCIVCVKLQDAMDLEQE